MQGETTASEVTKDVRTVQFVCPRCEEEFLYVPRRGADATKPLECPSCGVSFPGSSPASRREKPLARCLICGNEELYVQKDFNRRLGLAIVVTSLLLTFLVMLLFGHRVGILCLFALAIVDWIAYRLLGEASVCYLCQSVHRGFPPNPEHGAFYLGSEEKYKHLRKQWVESLGKES